MKYIFIGNRFNVLQSMFELGLEVTSIYAVKDSYLENELITRSIKYTSIQSKLSLVENIKTDEFDILVSNGCPYILPVSEIKKENQKFINIHPSLLPDLKGVNPINAAILFNRDSGATCHIMDDDIDTGSIISQQRVSINETISLSLLYTLCFIAEAEVFISAYKKGFNSSEIFPSVVNPIYYTRKDEDMIINFNTSISETIRQVRAFGIESQGARFIISGNVFKVLHSQVIESEFLEEKSKGFSNLQIILVFSNNIIIKKDNKLLALENIIGNMDLLKEGTQLG